MISVMIIFRISAGQGYYFDGDFDLVPEEAQRLRTDWINFLEGVGPGGGAYEYHIEDGTRFLILRFSDIIAIK
jgi:hypothetical protein